MRLPALQTPLVPAAWIANTMYALAWPREVFATLPVAVGNLSMRQTRFVDPTSCTMDLPVLLMSELQILDSIFYMLLQLK